VVALGYLGRYCLSVIKFGGYPLAKYNSTGHSLTLNDETIFGVIFNVAEDFEFTIEELVIAIRNADTVTMTPLVKKSSKTSVIASLIK
jgi:hypothetical protein